MMNDAELLRCYAESRSETAFAEFVERRIGFVHATALRQVAGDAHTAQDVTQAVFVLVAKKATRLVKHECLGGWLHTTTCNVAHLLLRQAWRRKLREEEAVRMIEIEQNASGEFAAADAMRPFLDEALAQLRENEREAVIMRFFEGHGFSEIGMRFKMSEDAARMRVARAVEKMRAVFAKRGVTSSVAALGALMSAEAAQGAPAGMAMIVSAGALTSAGAIAGSTLAGAGAILAFMSSSKITGAAMVALLIAGCGVFYSWRQHRAAVHALDAANRENTALLARGRESQRKVETTAVAKSPGADDPVEAGKRLLAEHPEIREKFEAYCWAVGYARSFDKSRELNLPPEKREAFAALHMGSVPWISQNIPGYGVVRLEPLNFPVEKFEKAMGEEVLAKLQAAPKSFTGHAIDLAKILYYTDTPLTADQARELGDVSMRLIRAEKDSAARWPLLINEAQAFLSAPQLRALMGISDRREWMRQEALDRKEWRERPQQ